MKDIGASFCFCFCFVVVFFCLLFFVCFLFLQFKFQITRERFQPWKHGNYRAMKEA